MRFNANITQSYSIQMSSGRAAVGGSSIASLLDDPDGSDYVPNHAFIH
jgi:hypothetical protein